MLTKSLHTVTAVTKVAQHLAVTQMQRCSAADLVATALEILGYDAGAVMLSTDTTVAACVKAVTKAMQS